MKGGNMHRSRGKHFVLTLLSVIFMTVLLWYYERKPLATTLLTSQDQFDLPTSDVVQVATHFSEDLVKPKDLNIREPQVEEGETDNKTKPQVADIEHAEPVEQSSVTKEDDQTSLALEETGDKTKPQVADVEHGEPVEQSSIIKEDDQTSPAHEETGDKTKSQDNVQDAESSSFNSSVSDKDEQYTPGYEETEDKTKSPVVNAENIQPTTEQSSVSKKDEKNAAPSTETKVCNFAKGKWIVDRKRPLYSGYKCKQWLSEMWACRLTQRPDFSYESYRWQPENCDMPEFERSAFLKRMQDKTIAFVGDSLGRQQFQSLMCMVTGGEENPQVQNVGRKYGLVTHHGSSRPDGWAFLFPETNTTILYYWSSCLCDLEPLNLSNPSSNVAMHLDRPTSFLKHFLPQFDVLILNTGHHWNRGKVNANRWIMYVDGKPNQNRRLAQIGNAKNFTIFSVTKWVDSQLQFHPQLKVFFRTISPRHFFNGEWNTGGSCENTTPLARGYEVKQDESSDQVIASAVRSTKVRLLDITALSQLRDEGHISRYSIKASSGIQDCLHWCLPGIPDTWNEILAAQL